MHYCSSSAGDVTAGVISHRHCVAPRAVAQLAQVPKIFTAQHTVPHLRCSAASCACRHISEMKGLIQMLPQLGGTLVPEKKTLKTQN
jgi:hypothetical protein